MDDAPLLPLARMIREAPTEAEAVRLLRRFAEGIVYGKDTAPEEPPGDPKLVTDGRF